MSIKDLQEPQNPGAGDPESFGELARAVFPSGTSVRLSRALGVDQRLAQRWIKGQMDPTDAAWAYVHEQHDLIAKTRPETALHALIGSWDAAGLDAEVQAERLARIYESVAKRPIE